tara:strand:- start:234 stop:728 length:495 start_codon:yes stop_codon:yes gene_type:complete
MVNASLNWASIVGLVLILVWIPCLLTAIKGLNTFSSSSQNAIPRLLFLVWSSLAPLICGIILFAQGWRLDPVLQFGQILLATGVVLQSLIIYIDDNKLSSKENAFDDLESLEPLEPIEPIKRVSSEKKDITSIEVELNKLKNLFDKELISKNEFQELKKNLLGL